MEAIQLIINMAEILFTPTSLIAAVVVFILTFLIITRTYSSPKFRKVFQGPDTDFLIRKVTDLEEAIEFINTQVLNHQDKKKVSQSLESLRKPIETLLFELS